MNELNIVEELLAEPLNPETGTILASQLVAIEAWLGRISKLCADAGKVRDQMKEKYRIPKSAGITDLDRTVMLEASTADFEADYSYLSDLQDTIRRRCTLGQSLLRNIRTEVEGGLRG